MKLVKNIISLKWIEEKDEWHMISGTGRLIQEFYDCETIHKFFPNLDKERNNTFLVEISNITSKERYKNEPS